MKQFMLLAVFIICCIQYNALSQSCLPDGITFTSQSEIDDFPETYPSCNEIEGNVMFLGPGITDLDGLSQITSIKGYLGIGGYQSSATSLKSLSGLRNLAVIGGSLMVACNDSLMDLSGLDNLEEIGGDLIVGVKGAGSSLRDLKGMTMLGTIKGNIEISYNPFLENLSGLSNITSVHGDLILLRNQSLKNLTGFTQLNAIEGNFNILANESIESFEGLQNLTRVGGILSIESNVHLNGLHGLENLQQIGGGLGISSNDKLNDLSGLQSLDNIAGYFSVYSNPSLTSLEGLENIHPESITDLTIKGNSMLTDCEAENICEYLSSPNGKVEVYDNAPGCEGVVEIANACDIQLSCLPYGNYFFQCQSDIDDFSDHFSNCSELKGDVSISGKDIYNLAGLKGISSIDGDLSIQGNRDLNDLKGMENLTSITGNLTIGGFHQGNHAMTSLSGLNNLSVIDGKLIVVYNNRLGDLTDLYNLEHIGTGIRMWYNPSLTSLAGLDNAEFGSMADIRIIHNESLSECDILSICSYLENDVNTTLFDISDNAEGCNSVEEIQESCLQIISHVSYFGYSNPYGDQILFKYTLPGDSPVLLIIYDRMGREVAILVDQNQPKGTYIVEFVNSRLAAGIYLGVLETNTGKQTIKLLKVTGQ